MRRQRVFPGRAGGVHFVVFVLFVCLLGRGSGFLGRHPLFHSLRSVFLWYLRRRSRAKLHFET